MTDLKLGILLWSQGTDWGPMVETARRVDRLGYDSLWTWDHLYAIYGDPYQPIFGGYEVLAGWAVATERAKLGLLVGANTFRNPGIVAKSVATLDHISGGRAIAGLGGAWFDLEHAAHGIEFGSGFGQRLDWLDESAGVIRSSSPRRRPVCESRFTAHHIVMSCPIGVTPESLWVESGTPSRSAVRHAHMARVRSGPIVSDQCWSPQYQAWFVKMFAHSPRRAELPDGEHQLE